MIMQTRKVCSLHSTKISENVVPNLMFHVLGIGRGYCLSQLHELESLGELPVEDVYFFGGKNGHFLCKTQALLRCPFYRSQRWLMVLASCI